MIFFTRRKSMNPSLVQDATLFVSRNVLLKPLVRRRFGGFAAGSVVRNLSAKCRRHGFIPWSPVEGPTCLRVTKLVH